VNEPTTSGRIEPTSSGSDAAADTKGTIMTGLKRAAVSLVASAGLLPFAIAQTPPAGTASPPPPAAKPAQRKSIVHHYQYPYPEYYHGDQTAGFRNPGGVGRYLEYYPPGNRFQAEYERDPVRVATFDRGGGAPDRAEQLAAQQIGIQRYNAIQSHIDNLARPAFGVGYFGGFY
jgi:hypothetical protein